MFYKDGKFKRFKGYRVTAIDGTKYNLPNSVEMKDVYGFQNSTNDQPQALGSCLYDVLNGIIIDALIQPFNASERDAAIPVLLLFGIPRRRMQNPIQKIPPSPNLVITCIMGVSQSWRIFSCIHKRNGPSICHNGCITFYLLLSTFSFSQPNPQTA